MSTKPLNLVSCLVPQPRTERGFVTTVYGTQDRISYGSGKNAIIRDFPRAAGEGESDDHIPPIVFTGHTHKVNVVCISPSGAYAASGDDAGNLRVWDIIRTDYKPDEARVVKMQVDRILGGPIRNIAWDAESKRILVVGAGQTTFGVAVAFPEGNSVGTIDLHYKQITAVACNSTRPFRAATGGDDGLVVFYHGAPYKSVKSTEAHLTSFVTALRFAPDNAHLISAGSNGKIAIYDGKSGDIVKELAEAHKGSVTSLSWASDSLAFASTSTDYSVSVFNLNGERLYSHSFTKILGSQQVSGLWLMNGTLLSLDLDGNWHTHQPRLKDVDCTKITGATSSITSLGLLSPDGANDGHLLIGTFSGQIYTLDRNYSNMQPIDGPKHTASVTSLSSYQDKTFSGSMDASVKPITLSNGRIEMKDTAHKASVPIIGTACYQEDIFVNTMQTLECLTSQSSKLRDMDSTPKSLAISSTGTLAIGTENCKLRYSRSLATLDLQPISYTTNSPITCLAFSPDGKRLAAGNAVGKVMIFDTSTFDTPEMSWTVHTGRISCLAWQKDGRYLASGSIDSHVYVYDLQNSAEKHTRINAHIGGVNAVLWHGDCLYSGGQDAILNAYKL